MMEPPTERDPPSTEPEILLESGPVLVVNKPGGLLTQAPPGIESLESRIKKYLLKREQRTGNLYLAVLHRLDRGVAGVMVFARHVRAARKIATQFENRSVEKVYWAIVEGPAVAPSGRWCDFVRKVPGEARAEIVAEHAPDAQFAALEYRVLATRGSQSILEIQLETGRTHQIRLQCASRGIPILGDELYGSQSRFGPECDDTRSRWIGLMSRRLKLIHPMTTEVIDITAPCSIHWQRADWRTPNE